MNPQKPSHPIPNPSDNMAQLPTKPRTSLPPTADTDALDRALARLVSTPIPDGLEQRILTNLASHTRTTTNSPACPAQPHALPPHTFVARHWRPLAVAAAATVVFLIAIPHHIATSSTSPATPERATTNTPPSTQPEIAHSLSPNRGLAPTLTPAPHRLLAPSQTNATSPSARGNPDADLALAELHAPSQLAPPLPLTDDERALQHLAQRSSPSSLLALTPTHRAAEEAADQAAFVSFFTPPVFAHHELLGESE